MSLILGIDEVGRGAWAGPLVVGAVVLGEDTVIEGLTDSKLLTARNRERYVQIVYAKAKYVGLGWVEPAEIDELGLTKSMTLAIKRAMQGMDVSPDQIVIDGSVNYLKDDPRVKTVIKADQTLQAVSAASVVAKVARDEFMAKAALKHPYFGFEKHVGYGTKTHQTALKMHGPTVIHRLSFKPVKVVAGGQA